MLAYLNRAAAASDFMFIRDQLACQFRGITLLKVNLDKTAGARLHSSIAVPGTGKRARGGSGLEAHTSTAAWSLHKCQLAYEEAH